jgi:hypothetical protein
MEQIGIALFGVAAVWLSQDKRESWRRFASIMGLIGQPFWFYATWKAGQWGMFGLCFLYNYAWGRGFYANWIKRN